MLLSSNILISKMNDKNPQKWFNKAVNKKILIVGAGGIGCEVIKLLCKSSHQLTLMDFDKVTQTNLNRQFCFRSVDLGNYKVDVLLQYFTKINPKLTITVQKGNLFTYDVLFFSQFDILISALDNIQARWYLNEMAIDHEKPMIDAGTSGFNGQAQFFIRYVSECRMCRPQLNITQNYAVCTLRYKPQKNIHCIHFGLNLFQSIKNIHQIVKYQKLINTAWNFNSLQKRILKYFYNSNSQDEVLQAGRLIHNQIFYNFFIQKEQQGTHPIQYRPQLVLAKINEILDQQDLDQFYNSETFQCKKLLQIFENIKNQQLLWNKCFPTQIYSFFFVISLCYLMKSCFVQIYDKDHFASSFFIFSVANLRISNFKCEGSKLKNMSYYECKDASGKIIPALASTNSIAAALQTFLISFKMDRAYLSIKGSHIQHKVQKYLSHKPKQGCQYCSKLYNYIQINANIKNCSWAQLQQFLIQNIDVSFKQRDIRCNQFVIVRNTGIKKWAKNKAKPLNFNKNLIQISKTGQQILIINYIPIEHKFASSWKIVVINSDNDKFSIRKSLSAKQYQQRIQSQNHIIQNISRHQMNISTDNQILEQL